MLPFAWLQLPSVLATVLIQLSMLLIAKYILLLLIAELYSPCCWLPAAIFSWLQSYPVWIAHKSDLDSNLRLVQLVWKKQMQPDMNHQDTFGDEDAWAGDPMGIPPSLAAPDILTAGFVPSSGIFTVLRPTTEEGEEGGHLGQP